MDLRVLRYFLTVAKEQSFTKAAKQLHITQPTLSRQLAALEAELGVTLFDRGGHGITLTNEGILLKRRALEMVDLACSRFWVYISEPTYPPAVVSVSFMRALYRAVAGSITR